MSNSITLAPVLYGVYKTSCNGWSYSDQLLFSLLCDIISRTNHTVHEKADAAVYNSIVYNTDNSTHNTTANDYGTYNITYNMYGQMDQPSEPGSGDSPGNSGGQGQGKGNNINLFV